VDINRNRYERKDAGQNDIAKLHTQQSSMRNQICKIEVFMAVSMKNVVKNCFWAQK
jgi:hypothetical protein